MGTSIDNAGIHGAVFITGMWDLVLQTAPSALLGPLLVILALYMTQPIIVVTLTIADFGEAEPMHTWIEVQGTTQEKK